MIYLNVEDLGWQPFITSWLATKKNEVLVAQLTRLIERSAGRHTCSCNVVCMLVTRHQQIVICFKRLIGACSAQSQCMEALSPLHTCKLVLSEECHRRQTLTP